MVCEPDKALKERIDRLYGRRRMAAALRVGYSTLNNWLCGFATMPIHKRKQIDALLAQAERLQAAQDEIRGAE